jgi:hypothetical protein
MSPDVRPTRLTSGAAGGGEPGAVVSWAKAGAAIPVTAATAMAKLTGRALIIFFMRSSELGPTYFSAGLHYTGSGFRCRIPSIANAAASRNSDMIAVAAIADPLYVGGNDRSPSA